MVRRLSPTVACKRSSVRKQCHDYSLMLDDVVTFCLHNEPMLVAESAGPFWGLDRCAYADQSAQYHKYPG
jgi:hypothetical protein